MKRLFNRLVPLVLLTAAGLVVSGSVASGQSVAFNDPFELSLAKGTWGVMLPSYQSGSSSDGGSAFRDDLDDPGFFIQLQAIRRFLHTRTSVESRLWFATAAANSNTPDGTALTINNGATGGSGVFAGSRGHLDADVNHYGAEFMLRDTWRTRFGGLSAGMTATYMAFDQDFDAAYAGTRLFEESLDSDFTGGKGFVGWDGHVFGYATYIDLLFGYFDVDAQYDYEGAFLAGSRNIESSDQTGTIEVRGSTRRFFNFGEVGLNAGAMYIAEMPALDQNSGPVTITDDDATTVWATVEWLY